MSDAGGDVEMGGGDRDFETTDVSYQSYCGKMKDSIIGVGIGFLLFFGSMGLLGWNEGRAVNREKDLEEGQEIVTNIRLNGDFDVQSTPNGLVHVTASVSTSSVLSDEIFGIVTGSGDVDDMAGNGTEVYDSALRLRRDVQMYQWRESSTQRQVKTSTGGTRTETTYSYDEVWSSSKINSDMFNNQDSRLDNPETWPFDYQEWEATEVLLGNVLELSSTVIDRLIWYEPIDTVDVNNVPDDQLRQQLSKSSSNTFYYKTTATSSLSNPEIGDMQISWEVVKPQIISIVANIENGQLSSFVTSRGGSLLLIKTGEFTSAEMFQQALEENEQLTWILRFVGFLMMFISILLILQPLSTAMDIIPFVGDCLGNGMEKCIFPCIAFTIALPVSLLVISIAWLVYRPAIAVPIFVGCGALICCLVFRARSIKNPEDEKPSNSFQQQEQPNKPSSYPPQNSNNNSGYQAQVYGNSNDMPAFSQALDNPPPSQQPSAPMGEPDIAMSTPYQPTAEPDIGMPAPYVPQVYKP